MTAGYFFVGLYLLTLGVIFWWSVRSDDCPHGWSAQTGGHKDDCVQCLEESLQ